ncbi:winged helix-turn-helix domain-containing protein [Variovorax sp. EL159]|uniref:winged helix-turn-helix domain-containing protein n=1 Tax=Variovorax sp. EL159 TaxID=1566270 RepID=UPI0008860F53|nr:winged helix-turn-helix domain-containing protein [Variovorax sp. EL159]SCX55781.1 DNA-binding response regulator, OmpR family, contains REC and winged-helix (wHTH) domain [Variovorax sp. EL159]
MSGAQGSRQIALVGCDEAQQVTWGNRLRLMGCEPASFDTSADFLLAVTGGSQFGLLLIMLKDEGEWPILTAMCKALRIPICLVANASQRDLLIAVLSAAGNESPGAHIDFAVLPIDDFELELRVRESLRRNETLLHPQAVSAVFGDYQFLGSRRVVIHKGAEIRLKPREFELALLLFRNAGRLLERDWLLASLWVDARIERKSRVLDCCVANIRRKLSLHKESEFVLHSVYGRGYELRHLATTLLGDDDAHTHHAHHGHDLMNGHPRTANASGFPDTSNEPVWLGEMAQARA